MMKMAPEISILSAELLNFRATNNTLSKHRRVRNSRQYQGRTMNREKLSQIMAQKNAEAKIKRD